MAQPHPDESAQQNDPRFVIALARGLRILSAFEKADALSHAQICAHTKLPKATVSRLINTLSVMGFLMKDRNEYFRKGPALLTLSGGHQAVTDKATLLKPLLKRFAEQTLASVNLAVCQGDVMLYLACHQSDDEVSVNFHEGTTVPVEQTAIGRAYYANTSDANRDALQHHLYARLGDGTDEAIALLETHKKRYSEMGYALSNGEYSLDILAAAVAIEPPADQTGCLYSLNASVPRRQWTESDFLSTVIVPLQALAITVATILK